MELDLFIQGFSLFNGSKVATIFLNYFSLGNWFHFYSTYCILIPCSLPCSMMIPGSEKVCCDAAINNEI